MNGNDRYEDAVVRPKESGDIWVAVRLYVSRVRWRRKEKICGASERVSLKECMRVDALCTLVGVA